MLSSLRGDSVLSRAKEADLAKPTTVEEYLAGLPAKPRAALEQLRKRIKAAAPRTTETISYQMPTFKAEGRFLLSYAAYKDHCSLYPASRAVREAVGDELDPYLSGKGTIRFQADKPLPAAMVRKIVKVRLEEVAAGAR